MKPLLVGVTEECANSAGPVLTGLHFKAKHCQLPSMALKLPSPHTQQQMWHEL